jgi:hypothetical protein
MPRICVAIPYFGAWPSYLELYLECCRANPNIDFLFFTDLKLEHQTALGNNVNVHRITLENLLAIIKHTLGINLTGVDPYKLCDLRPAYGVIFREFFSGYDYWGWSDIDIVLGRTKQFLEGIDVYDIWCVRKGWTTGSWTLLRNDEKINNLFRSSPDWKMIFQSSESMAFDECGGVWSQLSRGIPIEKTTSPIVSFTHIVRKAIKEGFISGHFRDIAFEDVPKLLTYDGRIMDIDGQEYFLFHFITAKARWLFIYPNWHGILPKKYYINKYGFFNTYPRQIDILRLVFSCNGFSQIKDKLLRRIKKTLKLLRKGDLNYLWRDLRRRMKIFINTIVINIMQM